MARKSHISDDAEKILDKIKSPGQSDSGAIIELGQKAGIKQRVEA